VSAAWMFETVPTNNSARRGESGRLSPSAGGLHPTDPILVDWRGSTRVMRYDAWEHRLELLIVGDPKPLAHFTRTCADILPDTRSTASVLVGRLSRVAAVYENPVSLLWRDAGALGQTFPLVATAFSPRFLSSRHPRPGDCSGGCAVGTGHHRSWSRPDWAHSRLGRIYRRRCVWEIAAGRVRQRNQKFIDIVSRHDTAGFGVLVRRSFGRRRRGQGFVRCFNAGRRRNDGFGARRLCTRADRHHGEVASQQQLLNNRISPIRPNAPARTRH
jgi:hypothetical protein